MNHHIQIAATGDPEVMRWQQAELPPPARDEVQIRHTAIGLNFIDVYFRSGTYPPPQLPFTPGLEAAGVVVQVGDQVTDLAPGDRVAYAAMPLGAYAQARNLPAARVVKIPAQLDEPTAAAIMLKGMTAHYLLRSAYPVRPGDTIVFHAAAGGVGLIACQWASRLGACVIGTVGGAEKTALAMANGCTHVIDYQREDWVTRVRELSGGDGVPVVYDSVGSDTFLGSLDCLKARGTLVSFGQSSGKIAAFDPALLGAKGSLHLTRPSLFHYIAEREELIYRANEVFDAVHSGAINISINQTYALQDAVRAHQDLQARRTTGSTILTP